MLITIVSPVIDESRNVSIGERDMSLKRRDFIRIAGGISLSLPLYHCSLERMYTSSSKSNWFSAIERWVPTVCQACPGGCGILVRIIDDRAVKVEGNPLHPLNRGRVCPKGQAGLQFLYNPGRIREPLKKVGSKHSVKWQAISWEEALSIIASKLRELRNQGRSHTVVFIGLDYQSTTEDLIARFLEVYGSPNYIKIDEWTTLKKAYSLTQGVNDLLSYDMENSRYILSFGADYLTNWPTSMENQRIYGEKRANREIKIVHISPRFSLCASRADRWIPINPGTEGFLALGIASIIIKEKLYNETFIDRFALRFEDFKKVIMSEVRLDKISDLTGVPLRAIIEIAKEFSTKKPAVAVADYNLSFQKNGLFNALSIHSLNALVGNIDTPGGILRQRGAPLKEMPLTTLDELAKRGISQTKIDEASGDNFSDQTNRERNFIENVLKRYPYDVNCLFLLNRNHIISSPISKRIEKVFQRIPFIVSFASFWDESSRFVDIILPDTTYFEKWQESQIFPLSKIPIVGIGQPVIKPLYQSKPLEDVILTLAKKIGSPLAQNFPWANFKELLNYRLEGLFKAKKGSIFTSPYEEAQLRLLEERGWWVPQHTSLDTFMKDLLEKGGWQDPSYHFNERSYIYQTPSRKFIFFSPLRPQKNLPKFSGDENEYPYLLYLYDLPFTLADHGEEIPWFQEVLGFRFKLRWETWVEVNPEIAREMGIHDRDLVWVESPYGKIKAVAKIFSGIMPHVIGIPLWKEKNIFWQKKAKEMDNPLALVGEAYDEETGMFSRQSTRVKIYKSRKRGSK